MPVTIHRARWWCTALPRVARHYRKRQRDRPVRVVAGSPGSSNAPRSLLGYDGEMHGLRGQEMVPPMPCPLSTRDRDSGPTGPLDLSAHRALARAGPRPRPDRPMIARGQSMRPFIPDGTPVMVRPLTRRAPRIGDIVLVPWGNDAALHRVVRVQDGQVTTRGDGCPTEDPPIPVTAVLGVAIHALRKGRSLPLDGPGMVAFGWILAKALPMLWWLRRRITP